MKKRLLNILLSLCMVLTITHAAAWADSITPRAAALDLTSGFIQGADGKFNPTANITRAETATVILRLLQKAELVDLR